MKQLRFLLLLMLLVSPVALHGQQSLAGHFSAGVNFYGPVGAFDKTKESINIYETGYMKYWGTEIEGSYRLKIYRSFQFHPSASLYYENHEPSGEYLPMLGGPAIKRSHVNELGFNFALPFGFAFKVPAGILELETGPTLGFYVYQKGMDGQYENKNHYKRLKSRWRFAAQYNFLSTKLYAKLAFDISMTNYTDNFVDIDDFTTSARCRNVLSGGIGINF